ncbi:MAG: imidazolonepropionase-like amidohydrolase [Rhodothermales bacterium]|jgi:imidazolonepropionase-like amidohydrolase
MLRQFARLGVACCVLGALICAPAAAQALFPDPFPSTYQPFSSETTVIQHATILTGTGARIDDGSIVMRDGVILSVGANVDVPAGSTIIDAAGKWVTPGIIDTHSHLGNYASPGIASQADGNELTDPNTAEVWAEHGVWPQDPGFGHALAGGVTSLQILPGSGNLFGGRGVTLKNVPSRTVQGMKFPNAPHALKMACGENPKRVYGQKGQSPASAMGNGAGYRMGWIEAQEYLGKWQAWWDDGSKPADKPERNLQMETLAAVLVGEVLVHNHCYRGDEMVNMINIANEFGYKISSFHHAVEGYKVRDYLAENDICASMWGSGNYGFKLEAYDGIEENVALVHEAGACAIVHSDSADEIQRLNQHSAVAIRAGREEGIVISHEQAIRWITSNPAEAMGISDRTGSLEVGKMADVVLWTGDPFSVYSHAEHVYIDGALMYDRNATDPIIFGDFMLGMDGEVGR